jgi:hypothetical protein
MVDSASCVLFYCFKLLQHCWLCRRQLTSCETFVQDSSCLVQLRGELFAYVHATGMPVPSILGTAYGVS